MAGVQELSSATPVSHPLQETPEEALATAVAAKVQAQLGRLELRIEGLAEQLHRIEGAGARAQSYRPSVDLLHGPLQGGPLQGIMEATSTVWTHSSEQVPPTQPSTLKVPQDVGTPTSLGTPMLAAQEQEPKDCQETIIQLVRSRGFELYSFVIIASYTVLLTFAMDAFAKDGSLPRWMEFVEVLFAIVLWTEVSLKIFAYRSSFFFFPDGGWNVFDLMICLSIATEMIAAYALGNQYLSNLAIFRAFRIMRVVRLVRLFRAFRSLKDLRLLLLCLVNSFWMMTWTILFLLLMILITGLVFVQVMTQFRNEEKDLEPEVRALLDLWFGSVGRSMLICLEVAIGGIPWGQVNEVILESGVRNSMIFLAYILFFRFAFLSIVTSVFVDMAKKLGQPDDEVQVLARLEEEHEAEIKLQKLFERLDTDEDGFISLERMQALMEDPTIVLFFEAQGLTVRDVKLFFQTLTAAQKTDLLDIEAFVHGCLNLKGPAQNLDVQALAIQVKGFGGDLRQIARHLRVPLKGKQLPPNTRNRLLETSERASERF